MNELKIAIQLREDGKLEKSNEILLKLAEEYNDNAIISYQCAWSFDVLGMEKKAVPYYEKAIKLGLEEDDLKGAYLGLGSTYRSLGEYENSKGIFEEALSKFKEDRSIKIFYAMTLYNLKDYSGAMEILLKNIAETSMDENIRMYKKAIEFYSDKLDEIIG